MSLTGVALALVLMLWLDIPSRITTGKYGQQAIQLLDSMRPPMLAIENIEYKKLTVEESKAFFENKKADLKQRIKNYLNKSSYNKKLLKRVQELEAIVDKWLQTEQVYWQLKYDRDPASKIQHEITIKFFLQAIEAVALGEEPVHYDINNGSKAVTQMQVLMAVLVLYLLTLIVIFQHRSRNKLKQVLNEVEQRVTECTYELELINREMESFSYAVSHDLRAPLRAIDGFSAALEEDCQNDLDELCKGYLGRIRAASMRMEELITDLLHLSRINRFEINTTAVDISAMSREICQMLQVQDAPAIEVSIDENMWIQTDARLIRIALENLIGNAYKYSVMQKNPHIKIGTEQQNNKTVLYIKDNGVGFDMEYSTKLFQLFYRLHGSEYEGTGIGLATVKRVIDRLGGEVWCESEPGKGAMFYFHVS